MVSFAIKWRRHTNSNTYRHKYDIKWLSTVDKRGDEIYGNIFLAISVIPNLLNDPISEEQFAVASVLVKLNCFCE